MNVREVTDEEVAFYGEHGWVKLDGLVDPGLTGHLLDAAKRMMKSTPLETEPPPSGQRPHVVRSEVGFFAHKVRSEPFYSFARSPAVGRAAQRLIARDRLTDEEVGVRYCEDAIACKLPVPPGFETNGWKGHPPIIRTSSPTWTASGRSTSGSRWTR